MLLFPSPSLKFRTVGFPESGFKLTSCLSLPCYSLLKPYPRPLVCPYAGSESIRTFLDFRSSAQGSFAEKELPFHHCYYEPISQSCVYFQTSFFTYTESLTNTAPSRFWQTIPFWNALIHTPATYKVLISISTFVSTAFTYAGKVRLVAMMPFRGCNLRFMLRPSKLLARLKPDFYFPACLWFVTSP